MQIIDILQLLVPNVWTAISQLCASAVLFFLMYKLAWKPVKKILDQRSEFEQSKLSEAEALKEENERLNKEAKQAISEANKTAETIVKSAREEGLSVKQELIEEGRQESRNLLDNAKRDIELQKSRLLEEMHEEIIDVALSATEKMLNEKLDKKSSKSEIDSFVKEVIQK